jgi:hypothetical protein
VRLTVGAAEVVTTLAVYKIEQAALLFQILFSQCDALSYG